jgi:hypothetical protein
MSCPLFGLFCSERRYRHFWQRLLALLREARDTARRMELYVPPLAHQVTEVW